MQQKNDTAFLPLFIREAVYVVDEPAPLPLEDLQEQAAESEPAAPEIPVMGNNNKHILLLVDCEQHEFLPANDQELLLKILGAVKLTLDDIALINVRNPGTSYSHLLQTLESIPFRTLISFEAYIPDWPLCNYFSKYVVHNDDTGKKILLSDRLEALTSDSYKKKNLWQCLQQLFVL